MRTIPILLYFFIFSLIPITSSCIAHGSNKESILEPSSQEVNVTTVSKFVITETKTNIEIEQTKNSEVLESPHDNSDSGLIGPNLYEDITAKELLEFKTSGPSEVWEDKVSVIIFENGQIIYNGRKLSKATQNDLSSFAESLSTFTTFSEYQINDFEITSNECMKCYQGKLVFTEPCAGTEFIYGIPKYKSDLNSAAKFMILEFDLFLAKHGVYDQDQ